MDASEQDVLQGAATGIIAADQSGTIRFVNAAASEVMGRPLAAGMHLTDLMPARLRGRHEAGFSRYVRSGHSQLEGRTVRVPALDADGAEREVDLTIRVFQRPDGTRLAVASVRSALASPTPPDLERIESALAARAYSLV